jgi:hypothetical protein
MREAEKKARMLGRSTGSAPPAVEHVNPTSTGSIGAMKDTTRRDGVKEKGSGSIDKFDWWKAWTSRKK